MKTSNLLYKNHNCISNHSLGAYATAVPAAPTTSISGLISGRYRKCCYMVGLGASGGILMTMMANIRRSANTWAVRRMEEGDVRHLPRGI